MIQLCQRIQSNMVSIIRNTQGEPLFDSDLNIKHMRHKNEKWITKFEEQPPFQIVVVWSAHIACPDKVCRFFQ